MNVREFSRNLNAKKKEVEDLMRRKMPVMVGAMAKSHFQDNFRQGGFVNNGLKKWDPAKRIGTGKSAKSRYGTLLSSRRHLFSNVTYSPGDGRVRVYNPVPYASAHQFGETVTVPVTPKMRRFAWAKYYEAGKGGKSAVKGAAGGNTDISNEAGKWKGLALTKKTTLSMKMPARPMIGESAELTEKYNDKLENELLKILNS